jgi:hypothetical protein
MEGSTLDHRQLFWTGDQLEQVMDETEIPPANPLDADSHEILIDDLNSVPLFCPTAPIDDWINATFEGVFETDQGPFWAC